MLKLAARRLWLARLLFFLTGALTMLSFAPVGWYPLALVLVLPVLYVFFHGSPRQAAELGFSFGAGLFLTGTYWLYISIHIFGEVTPALAIVLMLGLVVIMGLYYAATGWLTARLSAGSAWRFVIVAPAAWVSLEWLRGWFMSGFPWMTIGYSQIDSPLVGFAPVLGIFGVSFALMLSASAALALVVAPRQRAALALVAVLPWIGGAALQQIGWTAPAGPALTTTVVQGGVSQDQKWLPEQFNPTIALYRDSLARHRDSDLVVWPEVAIPSVLDLVQPYVALLEQDAAVFDTTLLFGILERDADSGDVYNSVVALAEGRERQIYRKRHLVPFGEYFPVPDFVREWMRMMNLPYTDITAGADEQPLLIMPDGNALSVAICYEDAYAAEQLYALPQATILINVSNDAWFGDSIAPHQHLQIARMRAVEAGRHVVRATNNGISAFIGPDGALLQAGPQFRYVAMTAEVVPRTGTTPYVAFGNWPLVSALLVLLAASAWRRKRAHL